MILSGGSLKKYISIFVLMACGLSLAPLQAQNLDFATGDLEGWTTDAPGVWAFPADRSSYLQGSGIDCPIIISLGQGEQGVGTLQSSPFTIEQPLQRFRIAGADGTAENTNDGDMNRVELCSYPDGEVLRSARPPGTLSSTGYEWNVAELIGREVYLKIIDANPQLNPRGFAWIGFANYYQAKDENVTNPVTIDALSGLKIDGNTSIQYSRTIPFLSAPPANRVTTEREQQGSTEIIKVGAKVNTLYLQGMYNHGWDFGVAHWGEHPEMHETRDDQVQIGSRIGQIDVVYEDNDRDTIPVVMGSTAWWIWQWAYGPTHGVSSGVTEPFASRPEFMDALQDSWKIREDWRDISQDTQHSHFYLPFNPQAKVIDRLEIHDNTALRGAPMVAAVTALEAEPRDPDQWEAFGSIVVDEKDIAASFDVSALKDEPSLLAKLNPFGKETETDEAALPSCWQNALDTLSGMLYMSDNDLPESVELIDLEGPLDATRIRFEGGVEADMLTNIWTQNLEQIDGKFDPVSGFFHESGLNYPWYGGYNGIGTWAPIGVYYGGAFGRCSDHFVTLALRFINNKQRLTSYVDFCDKYLYFYRNDHDPANGPPNAHLDLEKWPDDSPPHWGFVVNNPCNPPWQINELQGDEETDGHGSTIVGRWVAWRMLGAPTDDWLTAPREEIYGHSRWDASRDAADYICWLMDYTRRDVVYCEGEATGWAGGGALAPRGWWEETDRDQILKNYAAADLYEPYPSYVCMTALRCSAQMADAIGETEQAEKWRSYADRIQTAMIRELAQGPAHKRVWRVSPYSVLPSMQDSLVQAWFSFYYDGLDPNRWDPQMTQITRNTFERQINQPYGHKPVLAMGYGMGWITKAALTLDEMDDAGKLIVNIAKYSYDKNMDYVDEERGID